MRQNIRDISDAAVFTACEMFVHGGKTVKEIVAHLNDPKAGYGLHLNRQQIYPLFREAIQRGCLRLVPPMDEQVRQELAERYLKLPADTRVVNVTGPQVLDHVAETAASLILQLLTDAARRKLTRVSIGFGAGNTMRNVSTRLAMMLEAESLPLPDLTLVALTQGFLPERPASSPTTFLPLFGRLADRLKIDYVGLFAEPVVETPRYKSMVKQHPVVRKCFEAKRDIDIVLTSCAAASDDHSLFRNFLRLPFAQTQNDQAILEGEKWLGDVLWRPFASTGPITRQTHYRAVTLFELEELVAFAATEGKHAILVVGPCTECGESKSQALKPLLTEPTLRVCNHLVLDVGTARDLL